MEYLEKKIHILSTFTYISNRTTVVPHTPHRLLAISSAHRATHCSLKENVEHTF